MIGPVKFSLIYIGAILLSIMGMITWYSMRQQFANLGVLIYYYLVWVVGLITMWLYFKTATTDPGVLIRNQNYDDIKFNKELICFRDINMDDLIKSCKDAEGTVKKKKKSTSKRQRVILKSDEEILQNIDHVPNIYQRRYCSTCSLIRPPLVSHCRYCDHCVKEFDHHCYFTNNCIGLRNKQYFIFLIESIRILMAMFMFGYLLWLVEMNSEFNLSEDDMEIIILSFGAFSLFYYYLVISGNINIFTILGAAAVIGAHEYFIY